MRAKPLAAMSITLALVLPGLAAAPTARPPSRAASPIASPAADDAVQLADS